jgi:CDP-diacylglycerol---serine O-phosphatidyltransferase
MRKLGTRNLANIITLMRILGVGLIFWFTPYKTNLWEFWTIIIYTVICLTDYFDGWVARKLHIESDIGKILDPLADKILVLVFLPLLEMQVISSFPVFIILAREFAIMAVRIVSAKNGTIIAAKLPGKIKTAITLPVCGLLFARAQVIEVANLPSFFIPFEILRKWILAWPGWIFTTLIWLTVAITIWSFLDYFGSFIWQLYVKKAGGDEAKAKRFLWMLVPNALTLTNLFFGTIAVVAAGFKHYHVAALLVLLGMLLDALDGKLARKLEAATGFGAKLDSQADFISFGVAPSIIIFRLVSVNNGIYFLFIGFFLALLYYGSVHYRLKRFNKTGHSDYFEGLPSPIGAALVVLSAISLYISHLYIFIGIIIVASLLMISKIPFPHLDVATKKTFLRYLKIPAFIFFVLTILNLSNINIAINFYVYEILFAFACSYVISPIFLINTLKK